MGTRARGVEVEVERKGFQTADSDGSNGSQKRSVRRAPGDVLRVATDSNEERVGVNPTDL